MNKARGGRESRRKGGQRYAGKQARKNGSNGRFVSRVVNLLLSFILFYRLTIAE